jgi:MarR-like DNA-binding transcriptional regulator SgrR of sgrS sRNA
MSCTMKFSAGNSWLPCQLQNAVGRRHLAYLRQSYGDMAAATTDVDHRTVSELPPGEAVTQLRDLGINLNTQLVLMFGLQRTKDKARVRQVYHTPLLQPLIAFANRVPFSGYCSQY